MALSVKLTQYAVCIVISKTTLGGWVILQSAAMSSGAIIGLSLGFMIFVIVTTVVYLKRRAKANQNLGYTIHDGAGKLIYHRQTFLSVDYEFRN